MKLLFLSDLQLEAGGTLGTGEFGPGSRFQDQVDVLSRVLDLAVKEKVEVVGVLGDVFERSRPSPWAILAFQSFMRGCIEHSIEVLVLAGNHDVRSAALPSALSIFDEHYVNVALTPSLYPYPFSLGPPRCVIAALPWTPIARLVAAQPNLTRTQLNDLAAAALVESAHLLGDRCAAEYPDLPAILVGHWAVSGATLPTGLSTDLLNEPVIPVEGLATAGFTLSVLGHIHAVQVVTSSPTAVVYCGSPQVCNWGEADSKHGVWIYDTDGDGSLRFTPIADRRFLTLTIDPSEDDGATVSGWGGIEVDGALVRVKYAATEEQARRIDEPMIRRDLLGAGAAKVIFKGTVERATRARVAALPTDMDDSQAFELWLGTQAIPKSDEQALRDLHAGYSEVARG